MATNAPQMAEKAGEDWFHNELQSIEPTTTKSSLSHQSIYVFVWQLVWENYLAFSNHGELF